MACAALALAVPMPAAQAAFGFAPGEFEAGAYARGTTSPEPAAGTHPDLSVGFRFNEVEGPYGAPVGDGSPKDITADLPPGFLGNPLAAAYCGEAQLVSQGENANVCPVQSQVGVAKFSFRAPGEFGPLAGNEEDELFEGGSAVYNLRPRPGTIAELAFNLPGGYVTHLVVKLRSNGDYGLQAVVTNLPASVSVIGARVTIWGDPAEHHPGPGEAFLANPTWCTGSAQVLRLTATSWQQPEVNVGEEASLPPVTGCDGLRFGTAGSPVSLDFKPGAEAGATPPASTPSGFEAHLSLPFDGSVDGRAAPTLREAVVKLPEGVKISPAAAGGLDACSESQIGFVGTEFPLPNPIHFTDAPAECPDSSKVGSVEVSTPVLDHPLKGSVFIAKQKENPFGSLFAIYVAVEDPQTGVIAKLPGEVQADPATGQLTATFTNLPQLPYTDLTMKFFGGARAALVTPSTCGTYTTEATLTPWSGGAPVKSTSSFTVDGGPGGGPCPSGQFDPKLEAGTANPTAGSFSPFHLRLTRDDGTQQLSALTTELPPGLMARLAGVPYCADAALASIPTAEGSGAAEVASPSCPAASQVGTVTVGAGAGPDPFYVRTGKAYLAGPYKGAPISLAVVTPAVAGPFDLGNVVVRVALQVDPETTRVSAVSDTLPTILDGVPLDLRDVRVDLDRDGFTLNPTNCEPMAIGASVAGTEGATAALSTPFQATGCAALGFRPKLSMRLKGATRRGGYPALHTVLTTTPGQANISHVRVSLPHTEFLAQEHLRTICTRVQFAAHACPPGSVYGYARAFTPLLEQPLEGPVYLRSSSHKLPDLIADLNGQVHVVLDGVVGSVNKGISTSFEMVPDTPVSRFVLDITGGKKGLLLNSANLCAHTSRATVKMDAQNGRFSDSRPVLARSCGKAGKKKAAGKKKGKQSTRHNGKRR